MDGAKIDITGGEAIDGFVAALRRGGLRAFDVTPLLEPGMAAFMQHPTLEIDSKARTLDEHGYFAQTLTISEHTGAHIDAPGHIHAGAQTVDELAPDALIRPYKKLDLSTGAQAGEPIGLDLIKAGEAAAGVQIEAGDIVVLDFGWERYLSRLDDDGRSWWGRNEPGLAEEGCRYLAEAGVSAVAADTWGCDTCAKEGEVSGTPGHSTWFLPNGIYIIEGLVGLAQVPPEGLFLALPLKIKGGSGSPLRVVLLAE